jgi:hypothetical protein
MAISGCLLKEFSLNVRRGDTLVAERLGNSQTWISLFTLTRALV